MDSKAIIALLSKSKSTVNAIQALESICDDVTDRTRSFMLGPFSTPVAKAVSNQLSLMIKRDPDALCSSYQAATSLKVLCLLLAQSISARAATAAALADVRLTIVQSGLMRSVVDACAELHPRVHEQAFELLQSRTAGDQHFAALLKEVKEVDEQLLQFDTAPPDAGPEQDQQIVQLELQREQALQQINNAEQKYAPTAFLARYTVAASLLSLWAVIANVWPEKQLLDSHFKPSLTHAAKLAHAVLTFATPMREQYSQLRRPGDSRDEFMWALSMSVVQVADTICAYAAVVSKIAILVSEAGQGPQFERMLTQAPELASTAVLQLLCCALAWTALLNQQQFTAAAGSSSSSQLPAQQQQQQVPAHHAGVLTLHGCCVLGRPQLLEIAGQPYRVQQMAAIPHAVAYCLALRQEESLIRRQGRPTAWPRMLESPEESVPGKLYMPLARLCVEVLMLLDGPDVCFETVKLLYKVCYYRGQCHPHDSKLTRSQLDFLLLEAAPALVGLIGVNLPKDKSSEGYKALDYFVDVLMKFTAQLVVSPHETEFLAVAFEQQLQSTCVVLEAAIRITNTSNEPAIPQQELVPVVRACCEAAVESAQQQVAAAAAAAGSAAAALGACTVCDVVGRASSGAAAAAAGPLLPPELFSLLLSCVKLSTSLLIALDADTALGTISIVLGAVRSANSRRSGQVFGAGSLSTAERVYAHTLGNLLPGCKATWLCGSIHVVSVVYATSSGGKVRVKAANVANLAPWLHLVGRSLSGLGQMIATFEPAIHLAQGMRSSVDQDAVSVANKLAAAALQWLECVLDAVVQALQQQPAPQGQPDEPSGSSSSSGSAVVQLPLTSKAGQQLLQDCKQLQQFVSDYENLSSNHSSAPHRERLQQAKSAETAFQQQLQQFGAALCAAVPLVHCCNNPECSKLTRVSERQAKGVCSKCKQARYCCNECQAAHWPLHKSTCKLLSKVLPGASTG